MAGSVVTNPHTPMGRWMQQDLLQQQQYPTGLHPTDAAALVANSVDFVQRSEKINETAEALADWLQQHPAVDQVYYPKNAPLYDSIKTGGYGGLMSMLLLPHMCQRHFYDALDVAKGPSLGTNFTLVCPYTLLAHYHELDFAMSYNVPPNLIRIAVGLEPFEVLREKFDQALRGAQLYPKVSFPQQQQRSFSSQAVGRQPLTTTPATKSSRTLWHAARRLASFVR